MLELFCRVDLAKPDDDLSLDKSRRFAPFRGKMHPPVQSARSFVMGAATAASRRCATRTLQNRPSGPPAKNAEAANSIANHTPVQLEKWNDLILQYDNSLAESIELGRLTKRQGVFLKQAFVEYWTVLGVDSAAIASTELILTKWIEFNLDE